MIGHCTPSPLATSPRFGHPWGAPSILPVQADCTPGGIVARWEQALIIPHESPEELRRERLKLWRAIYSIFKLWHRLLARGEEKRISRDKSNRAIYTSDHSRRRGFHGEKLVCRVE